jgi:integrase
VTVYLPSDARTWRYSFYFQKKRYWGSTGQSTEEGATRFEAALRERLRREFEEAQIRRAAGLAPTDTIEPPSLTDWAEIYLAHVEQLVAKGKILRPERIEDLVRVALRFWGRRPSGKDPRNAIIEGEPYHDLVLTEPVSDPDWIVKFEAWLDARGAAGQTKNQYRSVMSQMYKLALQPTWRKKTGVQVNPFAGIYRDDANERDVTISREELRRLLEHASYHLRLAVAIGALAPKLRLMNILQLRWSTSFDADLQFITVRRHKTVTRTKKPLVIPISDQLREILLDARRRETRPRRPPDDFVVTYRGKPISEVRGALKGACRSAGLTYGRFVDGGVTFHTLRHTAATILAELDIAEGKRKSVMGHTRLETTQKYTHLRPVHERQPVEQLSDALPIRDLVTQPWRRASRKPVQSPVQVADAEPPKRPAKVRQRRGRDRRAVAS